MSTATTTEKRMASPWFMSLSLGADYGTFDCDICHREFYHSPSEISRGDETLHKCVCGNCTNKIISQDHGTYPYE